MLSLIVVIALSSYWIKHTFSFYEFKLTFSLVPDFHTFSMEVASRRNCKYNNSDCGDTPNSLDQRRYSITSHTEHVLSQT